MLLVWCLPEGNNARQRPLPMSYWRLKPMSYLGLKPMSYLGLKCDNARRTSSVFMLCAAQPAHQHTNLAMIKNTKYRYKYTPFMLSAAQLSASTLMMQWYKIQSTNTKHKYKSQTQIQITNTNTNHKYEYKIQIQIQITNTNTNHKYKYKTQI